MGWTGRQGGFREARLVLTHILTELDSASWALNRLLPGVRESAQRAGSLAHHVSRVCLPPLVCAEGPQRWAVAGLCHCSFLQVGNSLDSLGPTVSRTDSAFAAPLGQPKSWQGPPKCGPGDTGVGQGLGKVRQNSAHLTFFCLLLAPGTPEFATPGPDPV